MTAIINKSSDFSDSLDYDFPVQGAVYWNLFTTPGAIGRNMVPNMPAPVVVGAPAFVSGYARMDGGDAWVEPSVPETAEMTLISLARAVDAADTNESRVAFISNHGGPTLATGGAGIMSSSATLTHMFASVDNSGAQQAVYANIGYDPNTWAVRALRISATQVIGDDLTHNLRNTANYILPRAVSANALRIGGGRSGGWQGTSDHRAAAIFPFKISDDQLGAIYARVKDVSSRRGVIV